MKILLAIDGSSFSDAAVNEIASRPWPAESEVRIISVVEPPLLPTVETWVPPDNYIEALERAGEEQGQSIVSKAAEGITKSQGKKLSLATDIVKGYPKHAIIETAEAWGADLIVVGSARLPRVDKAVARLGVAGRSVAREVLGRDSSKSPA